MDGKMPLKPRLQIIRGLPGSGKSTLARSRYPHLLTMELDMFCMRGGEYMWSEAMDMMGEAWLLRNVKMATRSGIDFVVCGVLSGQIPNLWKIVRTAHNSGYSIFLKTLKTDFGNTHGCPESTVSRMASGFVEDEKVKEMFPFVTLGEMDGSFVIR